MKKKNKNTHTHTIDNISLYISLHKVLFLSLSKRIYETINILQKLPEVQLSAEETVVQIHDPSVCRHVSGLQFREQTLEQFVPKYPSLQARGNNTQRSHK